MPSRRMQIPISKGSGTVEIGPPARWVNHGMGLLHPPSQSLSLQSMAEINDHNKNKGNAYNQNHTEFSISGHVIAILRILWAAAAARVVGGFRGWSRGGRRLGDAVRTSLTFPLGFITLTIVILRPLHNITGTVVDTKGTVLIVTVASRCTP